MSGLQLLWFLLVGVLFSGYFFLDGFDYGVGMATASLAKNEDEKTQLIETIGPVWYGNEVWLITAGGALFASFPFWYAALFSGYYIVLFIILFGLIIRGVSFEFRHRAPASQKGIWNKTLAIGSFLVPFFFGILFISLIQGMPIDAHGNIYASFTDYINIFSIVGGVALTLLTYLHGLNYIALKTLGEIRDRARQQAKVCYMVLYAGLVVFAILLYLQTDFFTVHPIGTIALVIGIVVLTVLANLAVLKQKELLAFILSGLSLVDLVALLFTGLFPRLMISSIDSKFDLLITNASSSPYTLKVMTIVALTLVPVVLAYTAWTYYIFHKRIALPKVGE